MPAAIAIHSALTLAMMGVLFRWAAPVLEVDLSQGYFRWLPGACDPAITSLRKALPAMGPFDFGPPALIVILWIVRIIVTGA